MKAKEVKEKEAKRLEKMELKEVKMVPFDKMGNIARGEHEVDAIIRIYKMKTKGGSWYIVTLDNLCSELVFGIGRYEDEALIDAYVEYGEDEAGNVFEKLLPGIKVESNEGKR